MLETTDEAAIGTFQLGMTRLHEMTELPFHGVVLRGLVQAAWSPAIVTCAFTCNLQLLAHFTQAKSLQLLVTRVFRLETSRRGVPPKAYPPLQLPKSLPLPYGVY